jgi:hypothetical protein
MLDIDDDGWATGLADGTLIVRYLFGFRGELLTTGATTSNCDRCTPDQVTAYIASLSDQLDVDDDGTRTALTDGLLVLRWLLGFRGPTLVAGAVGPQCSRCSAAAIAAFLDSL